MKVGRCVTKSQLMGVALAVGTFLGVGLSGVEVQVAQAAQKVEVVIQSGEAKLVRGTMLSGVPTEISIRNEDSVTHGFNSSIFGGQQRRDGWRCCCRRKRVECLSGRSRPDHGD